MRNPAAAYKQVEIETGAAAADAHGLILMLFDGALMQISRARTAMEAGDIPGKGQAIGTAIDIVINGLKISLNLEAGGELSLRLAALYDYMAERLLQANLRNSQAALDEVHGLLTTLREAWTSIDGKADASAGA